MTQIFHFFHALIVNHLLSFSIHSLVLFLITPNMQKKERDRQRNRIYYTFQVNILLNHRTRKNSLSGNLNTELHTFFYTTKYGITKRKTKIEYATTFKPSISYSHSYTKQFTVWRFDNTTLPFLYGQN